MIALGLGAVEPDGLLVRNIDGEDIGVLLAGWCGHEAREKGTTCLRNARLGEGGLCHGVIGGEIMELDNVTDLGNNVLGVEVETT